MEGDPSRPARAVQVRGGEGDDDDDDHDDDDG